MKKYPDKKIELARELRKHNGYSFAHLQRITGIPATTIRNWCADDYQGTRWDTLLRSNERKRHELKISEIRVIDSVKEISSEYAKIFAALIYACEGSKYPSTNKLALTNSDPDLLKLFTNLLRKAFILNESKFTARLQIHDTQNYQDLKNYWSNLLHVSESKFIKPTITKAKGGKHRKNYLGTCTIVYADFRIQLKLIGIYEGFIRKFGEVA